MFISSWLLKSKGQFPFNMQKRNEPCDLALIWMFNFSFFVIYHILISFFQNSNFFSLNYNFAKIKILFNPIHKLIFLYDNIYSNLDMCHNRLVIRSILVSNPLVMRWMLWTHYVWSILIALQHRHSRPFAI